MMKKLFLWLVFFSIGMQAQNIAFADANFKAILLSSSASNTIAKNLSGNYFAIDANDDGEISITEALNVGELEIKSKLTTGGIVEPEFPDSQPIYNYDGINYFKNATAINIDRSTAPTALLDISGLANLKKITAVFYADNATLSINNCPVLINLKYGGIKLTDASIITQLKSLTVNDIMNTGNFINIFSAIENATLLENLELVSSIDVSFYGNNNYSLNLSHHQNIKSVSIKSLGLHSLDLSFCNQLSSLSIWSGSSSFDRKIFGKLNVSNCPLLTELNLDSEYYSDHGNHPVGDPNLTGIQANNCINLKSIKCGADFIGSLEVNNCPALTSINLIQSTGIKMSDVPALKSIFIDKYDGVAFDATPASNLEVLKLNYNINTSHPYDNYFGPLKNLTVKNNAFLKELNIVNHKISNVDVSGLQNLERLSLNIGYNYNAQPFPDFSTDFLDYLNVENCSSLQDVNVNGQSGLIEVNFTNCVSLKKFIFVPTPFSGGEAIEKLNFENCNSLETIDVSNCKLKDLNIKNCSSLKKLLIEKNELVDLDLSDYSTLTEVNVANSEQLISLNLNNCTSLESFLAYSCPKLTNVFLKNGKNDLSLNGEDPEVIISDFEGSNNIKYICCDESEEDLIKKYGLIFIETPSLNTYCSFTPGGNFNTISGTVKFDTNSNGCDATDNPFEFLKLKINDGTNSGETFAQNDGKYQFYTQAGNFNLTALAENPGLFNISPATFNTTFADSNNNVFTQDICVTANGSQNDAEVIFAPLTNARPGFDVTYKLVWRNKGNTTLSGKVILNYDASKMTFLNSSLPYSAISNGSIEFDYTNLKPFENTASEITFTINTPTNSTNPVNAGDILAFNAQITPNSTDLTPEDNNFGFKHTVVNSFDPNDIVCLEGETIPSVAVGKYLHYVVNFKNTGTTEAENIVVKMEIDPADFDINTLQLENASANVSVKITGNTAEFAFKKIKLQSGGHGNVLLKMRSRTDLVEGDTVSNIAEIYFDYNFPIETNDYVTTIYDASSILAAKLNYTASDFSQNNYKINFDGSLSTGNITNYQWEFSGNPSISSGTSSKPIVTYSVPGNYTAKLTVSDADNATSSQTISFSIGGNSADISTGKNSNRNLMNVDSDDDDWKGYDINGTEMTPKVRQAFPGWSSSDIGNGNTSQWISLNNFEGYYTYKSQEFAIPESVTDAKLNLRSLSFVRNWTYLVKINPDGSEEETEITKTQWMNDGFKGWVNSRSPKVDNYSLPAGRYYIKVLVYSNNSAVRESLDVNAVVSCSSGLMFFNKKGISTETLGDHNSQIANVMVYPIPTKDTINIVAKEKIISAEIYDSGGRILQKKIFDGLSEKATIKIISDKGVFYLKIKTTKGITTVKIIKD